MNSKFVNMTLAQAKRLMGTKRDPKRRAALPVSTEPAPAAIPAHFNGTQAFPQCAGVIGHIRDQSDCGCCWAFGSTESFNDRLCVATNATTLLSPQDTCSCCNSGHGCSSGGCDGGFTEDAFNYFMTYGLVSGGDSPDKGKGDSCFPYQLEQCGHHEASPLIPCPQVCSPGECATPKCPTTCSEKTYATAWAADKRKAAGGAYRLTSVAQAQADIVKYGSISAAFTVYSDFLTYTGGVYTHKSGSELGGHAVKIYGARLACAAAALRALLPFHYPIHPRTASLPLQAGAPPRRARTTGSLPTLGITSVCTRSFLWRLTLPLTHAAPFPFLPHAIFSLPSPRDFHLQGA